MSSNIIIDWSDSADVMIFTEDKIIYAHKIVLQANSNYFRGIVRWSRHHGIPLDFIDLSELSFSHLMEKVIGFIYTNEVGFADVENEFLNLFEAAKFLLIRRLEAWCLERAKSVDFPLTIGLINRCKRVKYSNLLSVFIQTIARNFTNLALGPERNLLAQIDIETFVDVLGQTSSMGYHLLYGIKKWIQYDTTSRVQHIHKLIPFIMLEELPPIMTYDLVTYFTRIDGTFRSRIPYLKKLFAIGLASSIELVGIHWPYLVNSISFDAPRQDYDLILFGDNLLVVGGKINGEATTSVSRYDISTSIFEKESSVKLMYPRYGLKCVIINSLLYAFGGNPIAPFCEVHNLQDGKFVRTFDAENIWKRRIISASVSLNDVYIMTSPGLDKRQRIYRLSVRDWNLDLYTILQGDKFIACGGQDRVLALNKARQTPGLADMDSVFCLETVFGMKATFVGSYWFAVARRGKSVITVTNRVASGLDAERYLSQISYYKKQKVVSIAVSDSLFS